MGKWENENSKTKQQQQQKTVNGNTKMKTVDVNVNRMEPVNASRGARPIFVGHTKKWERAKKTQNKRTK